MREGSIAGRFLCWLVLIVLISPISTPLFGEDIALGRATAATSSACSVSGEVKWGEFVANTTIGDSYNFFDGGGFGETAEGDESNGPRGRSQDEGNEVDEGNNSESEVSTLPSYPEEDPNVALRPLTEGFHVSQVHQNGSAAGIRVNLSVGKTYTFCVTTTAYNTTDIAPIDVYLISSYDWDLYSWLYQINGNNYGNDEKFDFSSIPPEWRASVAWRTFRDAHSYQNVNEVTFSTSLDIPQTTGGMFSDEIEWQEFRVVIDTWNNGQGGNAPDPHMDISVDITVMVEDRVMIPTWTVPIVCGIFLLGIGALPVILHMRYNKLGRENTAVDLLPSLDQTTQTMPAAQATQTTQAAQATPAAQNLPPSPPPNS